MAADVQRHHLGTEIMWLLKIVSSFGFEPNLMTFDGFAIQWYSVPVIRFVNTSNVEPGYTLCMELTRDTRDEFRLAIETDRYAKLLSVSEGTRDNTIDVVVGVSIVGIATALFTWYMRSR
jgi:hypothetical protein